MRVRCAPVGLRREIWCADALGIQIVSPEVIARTALELATTEGTGRLRIVRQGYDPVDWRHPLWQELGG